MPGCCLYLSKVINFELFNMYKVEDLLLNEEFKNWVISPNEENGRYWQLFLKDHPESERVFFQAVFMIRQTTFAETAVEDDAKDRILKKLLANNSLAKRYHKPASSGWKWLAKLAAVFAFAIAAGGLFYYLNRTPAKATEAQWILMENPAGKKRRFSLPDGTRVCLNSSSTLSYQKGFEGDVRLVRLKGEAYFEVAKDEKKPFEVHTDKWGVTALGTAFNLNNFSESKTHVALVEGKVKVFINDLDETYLMNPGEGIHYDGDQNTAERSVFDQASLLGWKAGKLIFHKASFEEVVNRLERWYGVDIEVKNGDASQFEWAYTGAFERVSIQKVMRNLKHSQEIDYEITRGDALGKGKKIMIYQR